MCTATCSRCGKPIDQFESTNFAKPPQGEKQRVCRKYFCCGEPRYFWVWVPYQQKDTPVS